MTFELSPECKAEQCARDTICAARQFLAMEGSHGKKDGSDQNTANENGGDIAPAVQPPRLSPQGSLRTRTATSKELLDTPGRENEVACFKLLADCVRFVPGKLEICGSCPLNLFQRMHRDELAYELADWHYKDLDIFMCAGMDFEAEVNLFEGKLREHGYKVSKRSTSRFMNKTDNPNINKVVAGEGSEVGGVRLIDYWIEGVQFPISLVNTCETFDTIEDVISSFDLSCTCISCHIIKEESIFNGVDAAVMFGFSYGKGRPGPGGTCLTPRQDLLSGQAVAYDPEHQNASRLEKYASRGFTFSNLTAIKEEVHEVCRTALLECYEQLAHQSFPEVEHLDLQPAARPDLQLLSHVPGTGLKVMTWNIEGIHRDASNIGGVVETVLAHCSTVVCLQEVTAAGFQALRESRTLKEHGYAVYGVMDQDYVVEFEESTGQRAYGLAFLTQLALTVQSFPFQPGEDTCQNRRFDCAFAADFAIVNLHAESNVRNLDWSTSERRRIRQFEVAAAGLRAGMEERGISAGFLCGDLNTTTASEGERFLLRHFTDVNVGGAVSTLTEDSGRVHKHVRYYDRILQLASGRMTLQGNWSAAPTTLSDHNCVSCELDFKGTVHTVLTGGKTSAPFIIE